MELDLLAAAETESDSESNHSNQDNASGRRSVVTAATAGSEAGMPHHLVFHLAVEVLKLSYTGERNDSGFIQLNKGGAVFILKNIILHVWIWTLSGIPKMPWRNYLLCS